MKLVIRRALAATMLAMFATGCQTIGELAGTSSSRSPAPQVAVETAPVQSDSVVAMTVPPTNSSNSISGMDSERLVALWGEPSMKRKDIGSELWTYGKPKSKCSILVYVYPSKDGRMVVARGEATPGGADETAVAACARVNDLPGLKPVS